MKKIFLLGISVFMLFSCQWKPSKQHKLIDSVVQIKEGRLKGVINADTSVVVFKGVPYAAPPVGELRWKAPQPHKPWNGIRDANQFGSAVMQNRAYSYLPWTSEFMVQGEISEDCLYLNIWTPAQSAEDKLPVLFFIHGGAFREGSGAVDVYNGESLAQKGIIVVTINYRLGVFGFLALPELTKESPHQSSGNYGFLDQIAALKWVKNNIAAFGGDAQRITIAGQSAGAMSVNRLLSSPLASELFQGAITESGTKFKRDKKILDLKNAEQMGLEFQQAKGVSSLTELRAMSAEEILAQIPGKNFWFSGNVDGYFLKEDPKSIFGKGKQNDVPFLTGINAGETSFRGATNSEIFQKLYPSSSEEEKLAAEILAGRAQSRLNAYLWLQYRAKTSRTKSYVYYFDHPIPWPEYPEFGAFHTSEVPYVFNNMGKIVNHRMGKKDTIIAEKMSSYWVNFVKKGNPNGANLPKWSPYKIGQQEVMELGEGFGMMPIATSKERFLFLKKQLLQKD